MPRWVRLWGKKRGTRLSGWWVVGSVGEAAFFGVLFLLGIISLTIVVSWQLFWPESTVLKPGFGFWLMVVASTSFIFIGITAFILQVSQTLASPEMRSALASRAKQDHQRRSEGRSLSGLENLPDLKSLTDSPGVKLTYRLAIQRGESTSLIVSTVFATAWNSVTAVLLVVTWLRILSEGAVLFPIVLSILFLGVSFFATRWFFQLFVRRVGIGPTTIEIDSLPLLPGHQYRLYLCQYGRVEFSKLHVYLVSFEETTFEQGTDVRRESAEATRIAAKRVVSAPFPADSSGYDLGRGMARRIERAEVRQGQDGLEWGEVSPVSQDSQEENPVSSQDSKEQNPVSSQDSKEQNPVSSQDSKEQNPVSSQDSKEQNPVSSQDSKEQNPVSSQDSKEQNPVSSQDSKEQNPVSSQDSKEQNPVSSQDSKEQNPVSSQDSKEQNPVSSQDSKEQNPVSLVAESEKPLELDFTISLPADMMHSFHTEHSAFVWKIVVEGECPKWPAFYRSFPVAVYPRSAL